MIIIQNQVCFPLILRFLNLNCDSFLHFLVRERRTSLCVVVLVEKGEESKATKRIILAMLLFQKSVSVVCCF